MDTKDLHRRLRMLRNKQRQILPSSGGGHRGFRFWLFFKFVFSVFVPKDFGFSVSVFIAVCGFFVFQHLVFVGVTCGFSVLLCDVVFGFSYFVLSAVFGFARIFMRFCGF